MTRLVQEKCYGLAVLFVGASIVCRAGKGKRNAR